LAVVPGPRRASANPPPRRPPHPLRCSRLRLPPRRRPSRRPCARRSSLTSRRTTRRTGPDRRVVHAGRRARRFRECHDARPGGDRPGGQRRLRRAVDLHARREDRERPPDHVRRGAGGGDVATELGAQRPVQSSVGLQLRYVQLLPDLGGLRLSTWGLESVANPWLYADYSNPYATPATQTIVV